MRLFSIVSFVFVCMMVSAKADDHVIRQDTAPGFVIINPGADQDTSVRLTTIGNDDYPPPVVFIDGSIANLGAVCVSNNDFVECLDDD